MKKKENIEMKEQTEKDNSDKNIEEETEKEGGEGSMGNIHWSQLNYRSATFSLIINFRF